MVSIMMRREKSLKKNENRRSKKTRRMRKMKKREAKTSHTNPATRVSLIASMLRMNTSQRTMAKKPFINQKRSPCES